MENREFYIDHDGLKLHAKLDFPAKAPEKMPLLVLEHGLTGHMEERHIRAVAQAANEIGFAVLRIELYGHGQSGGEFKDHTIMKWVDEMLTVIDYAASLDFVSALYLAGHSQGGLTAILVAGMEGDRLKGLLPLAPAIVICDAARTGVMFDSIRFDPEKVPDELVFSPEKSIRGNYFRVARTLPVDEAIRAYKGPVLIVHADTDEAVPVSYAFDAAEKYDNCELKIIADDTHCYDNKLDEVTAAVKRFLMKCEKRS